MANIFKDKASFERYKESVYQSQSPEALKQRTRPQSTYWYVLGYEGEERNVVGPYYTAADADRILSGFDDGEIFELETRDRAKATAAIKEILLEREVPPSEALKRVRHAIPEASPHRRRRGITR